MKQSNINYDQNQPHLSDADLARLGPDGLSKALDLSVKVSNRWRRQVNSKWKPVSTLIESIPSRYINAYICSHLPLPEMPAQDWSARAKAGMATYFLPDFLASVKGELRVQDGQEEIRLRPSPTRQQSHKEAPRSTPIMPKARSLAQLLADYFQAECVGCGVSVGEFHKKRCYAELCPYCGTRCDQCNCSIPADDRRKYDGFLLAAFEAIECGWFHYLNVSDKWVRCGSDDHPGAIPDWERVMQEGTWDRKLKRYALPD